MYSAPIATLQALPTQVDMRPQCPSVYDQGQLGSCTANAIGAAVQFDEMKQKLPRVFVPSRLFIYYNERAIEGTVNSDSGAMIRDGVKSVGTQGTCPETQWPYTIAKFSNKLPAKCYTTALKHKSGPLSAVIA
jgi:C1A family cysteine protease